MQTQQVFGMSPKQWKRLTEGKMKEAELKVVYQKLQQALRAMEKKATTPEDRQMVMLLTKKLEGIQSEWKGPKVTIRSK